MSQVCTSGILMVTAVKRTNVEFMCSMLRFTPVCTDSLVTSSMRGGATGTKVSLQLRKLMMTMARLDLHYFWRYTNALEVISYTLAENAGLKPIEIVMELRKVHAKGNFVAGIDVKVRCINDMYAKNVNQPLLVMTPVIKLATEIVCMIL
jgi:T-complex protein 1 subunit delta